MFNFKDERLCWLPPGQQDRHWRGSTEQVQRELREQLQDTYADAGRPPAQARPTTSPKGCGLHYGIDDSRGQLYEVHDRCVADVLRRQRDRDKRRWKLRHAVYGHCLVDVKSCPFRDSAPEGQVLLDRLQQNLRVIAWDGPSLFSFSFFGIVAFVLSIHRFFGRGAGTTRSAPASRTI